MEETPQLINVIDPDTQQVGSIPVTQLQDAISQGFIQATPEQANAAIRAEKYGTAGQQLLTGVEGATQAATFGLVPGLGKPEDVLGRREENPLAHMVGQGAGLVGSALAIPGGGAAGALTRIGEAGAEAIGLGAAQTGISRIGSTAVKAAIENSVFQGQDEMAKFILGDPNNIETAAANVGLAGILGGAIGGGAGSVNELWKATVGPKVGQYLNAFSKRMNGVEGVVPDAMEDAIQTSGLSIPPEVKTALSGDPEFQQMFKTLEQSDTTKSGLQLQETYNNFKKGVADSIVRTLGKTPKEIESIANLSKYDAGKELGTILSKELEEKTGPLAKKFEALKDKYANVELPKGEVIPEKINIYGGVEAPASKLPGFTDLLADRVYQTADQEGWLSLPSSEIMSKINSVMKDLPRLKKLSDLSKFISQVGNEMYDFTNPSMSRAGMIVKGILKDAEADLILQKLGSEGPELVAQHQATRDAWKIASNLKDSLDSRLHVGGGDSIGSFIKNLKSMSTESGERIIQRLSGKNDANILSVLSENFPQTANYLKGYHIDDLLRAASEKAPEGHSINAAHLMKSISKLSPELRSFSISDEALKKINAVGTVMDELNRVPHNFSNTARTLDKLSQHSMGSALAMAGILTGHNPVAAFLLAPLAKYMAKDLPDAVRLSMLKFMGSNQPIEAEGFKSMVNLMSKTIAGQNAVNKSVKAVFKAGTAVLPQAITPSDKDRERLDKQLKVLREQPEKMADLGGKVGHYMPDHATAIGSLAANSVNYLNSLRPSEDKAAPLDSKPVLNSAQKQQYDNALDIAQQPLVVLNKIKDGILTIEDVTHLKALYPSLYSLMAQKLSMQMIETVDAGETIPYHTRMSLSLFLGEPLDSTMTPMAIQSTQMSMMADMSQQPQQPGKTIENKSSSPLKGMSKMESTPGQEREQYRSKKA